MGQIIEDSRSVAIVITRYRPDVRKCLIGNRADWKGKLFSPPDQERLYQQKNGRELGYLHH